MMIDFKNVEFDINNFKAIDLFVACVGYEERSFFIYDQISEKYNGERLIITIDDYTSFSNEIVERIKKINDYNVLKYSDEVRFQEIVISKIEEMLKTRSRLTVAIDYSSMPRGWYCNLPRLISEKFGSSCKALFWYSEGEYSEKPEFYSTVGIDSYRIYSGKPSISTNRSRTHFIGVGYDAIRTQGLISILDPEEYVICEAYNPNREEIHENVFRVNRGVIEQTSNFLSMYINDIEFMMAKMTGLINEYYYAGKSDVILVPDGPKPLIFVMSMMPWLVGRAGVSCLYVTRNSCEVKKNNVKAQGGIIGFSMNII